MGILNRFKCKQLETRFNFKEMKMKNTDERQNAAQQGFPVSSCAAPAVTWCVHCLGYSHHVSSVQCRQCVDRVQIVCRQCVDSVQIGCRSALVTREESVEWCCVVSEVRQYQAPGWLHTPLVTQLPCLSCHCRKQEIIGNEFQHFIIRVTHTLSFRYLSRSLRCISFSFGVGDRAEID